MSGLSRRPRVVVAGAGIAGLTAALSLHAAGITDVTTSASVWGFSSAEEVAWWGGLWADRALKSDFARQALEGGFASQDDLERMSSAWREWSEHPDAWFAFPHGELLGRV